MNGSLENESSLSELMDLFKMASTLFISRVSYVIMKVTDSSLLGHTGTTYLEAVALSDLWTSSTGVFIQSPVAGMFCGQAFGAGNKRLVGMWTQVALAVLLSICVLVAVAWLCTGVVLRAFGESETLVLNADYFAWVLSLCLPVRIFYSQFCTFFAAQKILRPAVVCSAVGMTLNLIFGLIFVVGFPIPGWKGIGFAACPWVTTIVEYVQLCVLVIVFFHYQKLHKDCWPGWSSSHVTRVRLKQYLYQYVPQSLSIGSDWWRVSVLGAIVASYGELNVAIWNTGYRLCWICLAFNGSLVSAMGIKLSNALGRGDASAARRHMFTGLVICFALTGLLASIIICIPRYCGMIFSNDTEVLDAFEDSRFALAAFVGFMNLSVVLEGIPNNVGRTSVSFKLGVVGSWVGQVPGAYLCTRLWRADLVGLYTGSALGYALLCVLLGVACLTFDFEQLAREAEARSELTKSLSMQKVSPRKAESNDLENE